MKILHHKAYPIPNIPSLLSLRKAGAVCSKNHLILDRNFEGIIDSVKDICLEMIYPTDHRVLGTDQIGNIKWI